MARVWSLSVATVSSRSRGRVLLDGFYLIQNMRCSRVVFGQTSDVLGHAGVVEWRIQDGGARDCEHDIGRDLWSEFQVKLKGNKFLFL